MTSTPRLDSLTAGGTGLAFARIHLADGQGISVRTRPGADTVDEVFVSPSVTIPDTEAWENEDQVEGWLTGGKLGESSSYLDVPVEAVRALIVQHGGEHADQGDEWTVPDEEDATEGETAEALATRAFAEWGIAAHRDEDAGNTWLVVGYDQTRQGFPRVLAEPYAVLYLYSDTDEEEITVDRAPVKGDEWTVFVGDGTGAECERMTGPADQLAECVEVIAEWITTPQVLPDPLTQLADLHGTFEDGYTPEGVRSVFGRIADQGGPYLVCVWEYADEDGFGGNSQFYAEAEERFYEVSPDIHQWLSGEKETPGALDTWVREPVDEFEFLVSDDFHNYAQSEH
ncbi:hypothetical protein [Streptomyces sp. RLB3-6]|uniref:hypothetical protein n=1 Tax=Streptomyces sp. RLB3-6 TaxID=2594457 RepID=UPI001161CE12|nr:hypothetical protein [Streptomyces sp. RLB3-6]QDN84377.1 hypothetical protein FNV61_00170 [Streptomyces sp. RLB3-6]